jgi:predicted permease
MLVRATAREKEIAIRASLGAAHARIIRQLLTEGFILSTAGAALGIFIASTGAHSLAVFLSANSQSPLPLDVNLDLRVLLFTAGVTALTGILFGLVPAFHGTRMNLVPALKQNAGSTTTAARGVGRHFRVGDSLVISQVALSVIVMAGSALLVRTLVNLKDINPGFDSSNILIFGINPTLAGYSETKTQNLYRDLQSRLTAILGVISASYSSDVLLSGGLWTTGVRLQGQDEKSTFGTQALAVGPGFFETMRIPLSAGRTFSQFDFGAAQPVIVNQAFAKQFLSGRNVLGLSIRGGFGQKADSDHAIIGIVADTKYDQLRKDVKPTVYIPVIGDQVFFELRTMSNPAALISAVRQTVGDLDSDLPLTGVRTQSETVDQLLFNERLVARLSSMFGLLALILACIGIYGLLSYEVTRRTREIGIRSALGAQRRDVLQMVTRHGMVLTLVGLGIGVAAAIGVTRYLQSLLFGVQPSDFLTFTGVTLLLMTVALLASFIPARRATKVEPMVALRYE